MSPRGLFLIFLAVLPILVTGRGVGHSSSHGGGYSHGSSGHGSHGTQGHTYAGGSNLSGNNRPNHNYPNSKGWSGNNQQHHSHKTEVHNHYYNPPQQVHYGTGYHPVYHGAPPVYVYHYHDSGSRYGDLLTGLALYNLGRMSAHHNSHYYSHAQNYQGHHGEHCEFQIMKSNGEYEKTRMDCQLMSSFIVDEDRNRAQQQNRVVSKNTNSVTTVTKESKGDNSSEVITTTVQNTTVVEDLLQTKGPSIQVTPGMQCFMVRIYGGSTIRRNVDCGLLQTYARSSFNASSRNMPLLNFVILWCSVIYFII